MALTNPRVYTWTPDPDWPSQPFIAGEGFANPNISYLYHLEAGDGHRIPFPRGILAAETYWNAQTCRVGLYVETGGQPHQGVDYVMDIMVSGDRRLSAQIADAYRQISPGSPRLPYFGMIGGGVGQGVVAVARPSPIASESHWEERVALGERHAVVHYDYLPA